MNTITEAEARDNAQFLKDESGTYLCKLCGEHIEVPGQHNREVHDTDGFSIYYGEQ